MPGEKLPAKLHPDLTLARAEDSLTHVSRVYQYFLRVLFAAMPSGRGTYHWTEDKETTEITLLDKGPVGHEILEKRPAVITIRGQFGWTNVVLDQMQAIIPGTGERIHTDLVSGSMMLNCVARNGIKANRIASLVASGILKFRRELTQLGLFHQISGNLQITPEHPASSALVEMGTADFDYVNVQVISPVQFQDTWSIRALDRDVLRSIEGTLRARMEIMLTPDQQRRSLRDPTYHGSLLEAVGGIEQPLKI